MDSPNFSLNGRVAIVTGASRGIGSSLAAALCAAGAAVVLVGREAATLKAAEAGIGAHGQSTMHVVADLTRNADITEIFQRVMRRFGRIDILINNAGTEQVCESKAVSETLWDRIVDTNLKAAFFCSQAAAQCMPRGGSIVNICSLTAEAGVPGAAAYGASKSGLVGLTRALSSEWAALGIRVNGIGPGYLRTALTETFFADPSWQDATLAKIPLRRFGRLEDLSGAAIFLCSDASAYMTGQVLYVDGGLLAAL